MKKDIIDVKNQKKKVTLSLAVQTSENLEEMAKKYEMSKSGFISFLINQAKEKGTIYQ